MKPLFFLLVCLNVFAIAFRVEARAINEDTLKNIQFDQKLGVTIPLNTPFVDETGKAVKLGDYFGKKPVILVLGYYGCPMLCTFVINGMIGSLQDMSWEIGNQFEVVNISIDPTEKPALAAAKKKSYVRRYGRHDASSGWHFLTGNEADIRAVASEVGFQYAYDTESKQYAHASGLVILTQDGKISHYLSGVVYSTKELGDALVDASKNKIGSPIRQLFLLCFHYSPVTGKYAPTIMWVVRLCGIAIVASLVGGIIVMLRRERGKTNPADSITG